MAVIFIENKPEAAIAAEIATRVCEDTFTADDFLHNYTHNVLGKPYYSNRHEAIEEIATEIHVYRTQNRANWQGLRKNSYSDTDRRLERIEDHHEQNFRKRDAVIEAAARMGADYEFAQREIENYDLERYTVRGAALQIHADWVRDNAI